jgi:hypothetical protein
VNTKSTVTPGRLDHPPQPVATGTRPGTTTSVPHVVRRVGVLDRAALHLGVALIKWGRRPVRTDLREELALNAETHRARLEAERERDYYKAVNLPRIL